MKKKVLIILGTLIVFSMSCVGCGNSTSDTTKDERVSEKRDSVKGTWVLTEITSRDEPIAGEALTSMYGGEFIYDFIDGKTVVVGVEPTTEECVYIQEGALITVTFEGNGSVTTLTMTDDDTMEIDDPDTHMVLIRQ